MTLSIRWQDIVAEYAADDKREIILEDLVKSAADAAIETAAAEISQTLLDQVINTRARELFMNDHSICRTAASAAVKVVANWLEAVLELPRTANSTPNTRYWSRSWVTQWKDHPELRLQMVNQVWHPVVKYMKYLNLADLETDVDGSVQGLITGSSNVAESILSPSRSPSRSPMPISPVPAAGEADNGNTLYNWQDVTKLIPDLLELSIKTCFITAANAAKGTDALHQIGAAVHGASYGYERLQKWYNKNGMPYMTIKTARAQALAWWTSVHPDTTVRLSAAQVEVVEGDGEYGLVREEMIREVLRVSSSTRLWPDAYGLVWAGNQVSEVHQDMLRHQLSLSVSKWTAIIMLIAFGVTVVVHSVLVGEEFYESIWIPFRCLFFFGGACNPYPTHDDIPHEFSNVVVFLMIPCTILLVMLIRQGLINNNYLLFHYDKSTSLGLRQQFASYEMRKQDLFTILLVALAIIMTFLTMIMMSISIGGVDAIGFLMIVVIYTMIHLPLVCALYRMRATAFSTPTFMLGVTVVVMFNFFQTIDNQPVHGFMACFMLYLTFYLLYLGSRAKTSFPDKKQNSAVHYAAVLALIPGLFHMITMYRNVDEIFGSSDSYVEGDVIVVFTFISTFYLAFGVAGFYQYKYLEGGHTKEEKSFYQKMIAIPMTIVVLLSVLLVTFFNENHLDLSMSQTIFMYATGVLGLIALFFFSTGFLGYNVSWVIPSPCPDSLFFGQPLYRIFDEDIEQTKDLLKLELADSKHLRRFSKPVVLMFGGMFCVFTWSIIGLITPVVDDFMSHTKIPVSQMTLAVVLIYCVCGPLYTALTIPLALSALFGRLTKRPQCNLLSATIGIKCDEGYNDVQLGNFVVGSEEFYEKLRYALGPPFFQCTGKQPSLLQYVDTNIDRPNPNETRDQFKLWYQSQYESQPDEADDKKLGKADFAQFLGIVLPLAGFRVGVLCCVAMPVDTATKPVSVPT